MFDKFIKKADELISKDEPFAIAIVVNYKPPISSKTGNKAIIQDDGKIFGWIGGGCTQPIIIEEAKRALKDGKPRLVRVSPSPKSDIQEGIMEYNMTCHSGGSLDIYIEPVRTKPHLIIMGRSAVGKTLAKLGKILDYNITVVGSGIDKEQFPDADVVYAQTDLSQIKITRNTYVVVSTQGEYDEEALEHALNTDVHYIAFVSSKEKFREINKYFEEKGVSAERLKQIKAPAGLDIKAQLPDEIAVSILAEIISVMRGSEPGNKLDKSKLGTDSVEETIIHEEFQKAKDPICGMQVDIHSAKYTSDFQDEVFYFCSAGCKQTFEKEPDKYINVVHED